jgi:hypothetical protein
MLHRWSDCPRQSSELQADPAKLKKSSTYALVHANPQLLLHVDAGLGRLPRTRPAAEDGGHNAQARVHLRSVWPLDLEVGKRWQAGGADFV